MVAIQSSGSREDVRLEDPIAFLRNEQSSILSQLWVLEHTQRARVQVHHIVRALIRDSEVYLKREAIFLEYLDESCELGGRSFHRLIQEQDSIRELRQHVEAHVSRESSPTSSLESTLSGLEEFTTRFRDHLHHLDSVVFVLARTRLTVPQQKQLAYQLLAT